MKNLSQDNQGNALFIVLITIAVFAMLAAAIYSSISEDTAMDKESAQLQATDVLNWADAVKSGANYMMLNNETLASDISFKDPRPAQNADPTHAESTDNPNSRGTIDEVFHANGGAVIWRDFSASGSGLLTSFFNGAHIIDGVGTSAADLAYFIPGFPRAQCEYVNKKAGLGYTDGNFPTDTTVVSEHFKSFGSATLDNVSGAPYGCFLQNASPETFWFYYVILPR